MAKQGSNSGSGIVILVVLGLIIGGIVVLARAIMPPDGRVVGDKRYKGGPALPLSAYKPGPAKLLKLGKALYLQHCQLCHGPKGKGDGLGARNLSPLPTPYLWGKFRHGNHFDDILRIITKGSPNRRSQMISWNWLPIIQRKALAHYVLAMSVANTPKPKVRPATKRQAPTKRAAAQAPPKRTQASAATPGTRRALPRTPGKGQPKARPNPTQPRPTQPRPALRPQPAAPTR